MIRLLVLLCWMFAVSAPAVAEKNAVVIGVSGSGPDSNSVRHIFASLMRLGAYPILLDKTDPSRVNEQLELVHGVVIAGNSQDINPADYGEALHDKTVNEDAYASGRTRSNYEYPLIEAVIERQLPFFGICGGMQRLNVANHVEDGGTLVQHIDGQNQFKLADKALHSPYVPVEFITIAPDTTLATIAGKQTDMVATASFKENTLHHQGIGTLRRGFRVSARNSDGVIEAIEADPNGPYASHPFLLGVQWHPEYGISPISYALFKDFLSHAKAYQKDHTVSLQQAKRLDRMPGAVRQLAKQLPVGD